MVRRKRFARFRGVAGRADAQAEGRIEAAETFVGVVSLERMRLLKIIMTALVAAVAVLAGLFIAVVAAITGAVLFFSRRPRGTPASPRTVPLSPAAGASPRKPADVDVIDVIATEVPASDPTSRS
jgi:hypothetical protein